MGRRRNQVIRGKTRATDRRATRRYFLFTPDEAGKLEQAFWYTLGFNANKHSIEIHCAVCMSTHGHVVHSDPCGVEPLFRRDFHRDFANCVKAIRGWPEEVFNKSRGGNVDQLNPKAVLESIAYAIANPSKAFAVRYAKDWPGAKTLPSDVGQRVIRVKRPDHYFDPKNPQWPEYVELEITMPGCLEAEYGGDEARRIIAARVKEFEQEALAESKERGIPFKGARRVMRTPHTARARSYEVFGKVNPRFSAAGDLEQARNKIAADRKFDADYDTALARWTSGDRRVRFPHGTWWMRVHHGARCRPPP
ncbi:MAG: transposase [Deltaproteobacteria bacterium]|nr:transposase [Deltaproteobacteria bacterium]